MDPFKLCAPCAPPACVCVFVQMAGYFVSVVGFAMYSRLKLVVRKHKQASSKKKQ